MRVFVAMDIPEDVRRALEEFAGPLARLRCGGARWVRLEGAHVTLKFIGEVSAEKAERIRVALAEVRDAGPVELRFRGTGFFPHARRPRVFWAGIEASPNLAALAAEIETRLETLGIPREQRAFHPHLTLARFKSEGGLEELCEAIARRGDVDFGATEAREFHLYESKLQRGGAVYTRLATFPLAQAA
jgi:2'-5' RNA ligase